MIQIPFLDNLLRALHPQVYDDVVDRLNYYYTVLFLMFFSILVSAKQYVGSPIQCWFDAEFKGGWEEFAEDYCFVKNTYFVPLHKDIPNSQEHREAAEIGYYQWVPIVLAVQAFMFFIPNALWKACCWQSGINLKSILKMAGTVGALEAEKREGETKTLCRFIEESLGVQKEMGVRGCRAFPCVSCGKRLGSYLNSLYLFIKLLYVVNIVGQFFLMNAFLGTGYRFWGIQILDDLIHQREWSESGHFPRITMCDFKIRRLGNIQPWSVQCVLMINMFNEKIYLFLWFWFLFVAICTVGNFLYWLCTSVPTGARERIVERYVRIALDDIDGKESHVQDRAIRRFTHNVLRPDGVLLLRFVSGHAGDLVSTAVAGHMLKSYAKRSLGNQTQRAKNSDPEIGTDGSTKSTSPENGFNETLYEPDIGKKTQQLNGSLTPLLASDPAMQRTMGGYPGPPVLPRKPDSLLEKLANAE